MSNKFSRSNVPLNVEVRPSKFLLSAIVALAVLALIAMAQTSLPASLQLPLCGLAIAYFAWQWRAQSRQHGLLQWHNAWQWTEDALEPRAIALQSAVIWPGLIVLNFRDAVPMRRSLWLRRNLTLTLWRDSLDTDDARRLRAYLQHWPVLGDDQLGE